LEKPTEDEVKNILVEIIEDLIQDWELDLEEQISGSTLLVADLEFASVDIIQLCVAIEQHYNRKIGFQELLMQGGKYISDLSIDELATFLRNRL